MPIERLKHLFGKELPIDGGRACGQFARGLDEPYAETLELRALREVLIAIS